MAAKLTDFDSWAAFYSPHIFEDSVRAADDPSVERLNPNTALNAHTIACLADVGIGSVFVARNGFNGLDSDTPTATARMARIRWEVASHEKNDLEIPLAAGGITVVRARCATPAALTQHVPVINQGNVRSIGKSKWRQYQLFGEDMPPTVYIDPQKPFNPKDYEHMRGHVFLKRDNSRAAKKIIRIPVEDAQHYIPTLRSRWGTKEMPSPLVVQQSDPGILWPGVKARRSRDQVRINDANTENNHELRLFSFATPGNPRISGIYKLYAGEWEADALELDSDTIPQEAYDLGSRVVERVLQETAAPGVMAGIDLYVNHEGQMRIREINLCQPDFVIDADTPIIPPRYIRLHANQLAELATTAHNHA